MRFERRFEIGIITCIGQPGEGILPLGGGAAETGGEARASTVRATSRISAARRAPWTSIRFEGIGAAAAPVDLGSEARARR